MATDCCIITATVVASHTVLALDAALTTEALSALMALTGAKKFCTVHTHSRRTG